MNASNTIITCHKQNNKTLNKTPNINDFNNNHSSKLDILKMELLALSKHGIQYQDFINDLGLLIVYHSCGIDLQRTELVKNKYGRELLCEDFTNHFLKLRTCSI
ncbi:MAG: hypothetical protein ACK5XF_04450 [Neisseriaceae bacterium]|jgi:hypothetical protein